MLLRSPEFRYLISTTNPYFLSVSVVDDTITLYVTSQLSEQARSARVCSNSYKELVPGILPIHEEDPSHSALHSKDLGEDDVPHLHYKHSKAGTINRATLYKQLHHFKKCISGKHGLTNDIINDIDSQYKEFKMKEKTGELKSRDLFETSNNPIYKNHKAKDSSRLPSILQHRDCVLDDKFSRGCEFSSTQWMIPRLIMCKAEDKPKETNNTSQCRSQRHSSATNSYTPLGSISSIVSSIVVGGALLVHLGFLSCLKRKGSKKEAVKNVRLKKHNQKLT